jgi:class 3 adenylate cyclase
VGAGPDSVRGSLRRTLRALTADAPSALEVLLGPERSRLVVARAAALWGAAVAGTSAVVLLLPHPDIEGVHTGAAIVLAALGCMGSLALLGARSGLTDRLEGPFIAVFSVAMIAEVGLFGPRLEIVMTSVGAANALVYLFVSRRNGIVVNVVTMVGYAVVVLTVEGHDGALLRILVVAVATVASAAVSAWAVGLIEDLEAMERAARAEVVRAQTELRELNRQLEERIDEQGAELGSLRQLRQFLSSQVAEAVLADGMEALAPHRCRIAVVFCDLRGFTSFSSTAEPEEVMEVLDRYYVTVGRALQARRATVGTFAGDGIMAYFGDPVPHEDPAGTAVEMAVALREPMHDVVTGWRRRGFDLGCGMGIAFGYATIGPVGFDERTDYTALGPTVNLASRLCSMAQDAEILIDGRTFEAVEGRVETEERITDVRGFRAPVTVHNVLRWCAERGAALT